MLYYICKQKLKVSNLMSLTLHGKKRYKDTSRTAILWAVNGFKNCLKLFNHPKDREWYLRGDIYHSGIGVFTGVFNNYISINDMDYFEDDGNCKEYCYKYMGRPVRSNFFM